MSALSLQPRCPDCKHGRQPRSLGFEFRYLSHPGEGTLIELGLVRGAELRPQRRSFPERMIEDAGRQCLPLHFVGCGGVGLLALEDRVEHHGGLNRGLKRLGRAPP